MTHKLLALLLVPAAASLAGAQVYVQGGPGGTVTAPGVYVGPGGVSVPGVAISPGGGVSVPGAYVGPGGVVSSGPGGVSVSGAGSSVTSVGTSVNTTAYGVGNSASVSTGFSGSSQGISIVNNDVWIDGEKVPPNATRFTGRSGKTYTIDRSGGGVRVTD